jgi:hypothetical protein
MVREGNGTSEDIFDECFIILGVPKIMAALRVPERKILIKIKGFRQGPELILYPW